MLCRVRLGDVYIWKLMAKALVHVSYLVAPAQNCNRSFTVPSTGWLILTSPFFASFLVSLISFSQAIQPCIPLIAILSKCPRTTLPFARLWIANPSVQFIHDALTLISSAKWGKTSGGFLDVAAGPCFTMTLLSLYMIPCRQIYSQHFFYCCDGPTCRPTLVWLPMATHVMRSKIVWRLADCHAVTMSAAC